MDPRKHLVDWLKDAHAMEEQAVQILNRQADRLENYPEAQVRIRQHAEESEQQARRVAECITRLDSDVSTTKDFAGRIMGNISAMTNAMAGDEVVKNAIANYAFENLEIASYESLIAAAEAVGDTETARVCSEILKEEQAMASWLESNLPELTRMYLERDAAGMEAKH